MLAITRAYLRDALRPFRPLAWNAIRQSDDEATAQMIAHQFFRVHPPYRVDDNTINAITDLFPQAGDFIDNDDPIHYFSVADVDGTISDNYAAICDIFVLLLHLVDADTNPRRWLRISRLVQLACWHATNAVDADNVDEVASTDVKKVLCELEVELFTEILNVE